MFVTITIPGPPRGKGRPRIGMRGKKPMAFTDKKTEQAEMRAGWFARKVMAGRPPLEGPVQVFITATLPVASSWPKRDKAAALAGTLLPTKVPDIDNIAKLVLDAINGVVFVDDRQITTLVASKRYGETPGVVVTVRPAAAIPKGQVA